MPHSLVIARQQVQLHQPHSGIVLGGLSEGGDGQIAQNYAPLVEGFDQLVGFREESPDLFLVFLGGDLVDVGAAVVLLEDEEIAFLILIQLET